MNIIDAVSLALLSLLVIGGAFISGYLLGKQRWRFETRQLKRIAGAAIAFVAARYHGNEEMTERATDLLRESLGLPPETT